MFDNLRVSEVGNHPPNTNDIENEQNSSVSDICKSIINFLRDNPDLNENEELKQEINSFLLKLL